MNGELESLKEDNERIKRWYRQFYYLMRAAAIAAIRLKTEQDALRIRVRELVTELKSVGFTCIAGPLENCTEFKELERLVAADEREAAPNQ